MANGNLLNEFTTFWESTAPTYFKGPKSFINEEQLHSYTMPRLQRAYRGSDGGIDKMLRGGKSIKDRIFFDVAGNFQRVNVNHKFDYVNTQTGTDWETFWSKGAGYVTWNEDEKGLNIDASLYTDSGLGSVFKDVTEQKMQNMYTDYCNSREAELWAVPDKSLMEVSAGNAQAPMSIPVFINEYPNGLPQAGDQPGGSWTTKQGLDPTATAVTNGKWQAPKVAYAYTAGAAATTLPLFDSFSGMYHTLRFDRLPKHPEYGEKTSSPHFIGCSLTGLLNYEAALRLNQDVFRGRGKSSGEDPAYDGPTYMGIPIDRISTLETAALYPTADASDNLSTELDTGGDGIGLGVGFAGPRYYFINAEYLRPTYHKDDYMKFTKVITPSDKPFDRVQVYSVKNQLVCTSQRRCGGIVYPSADVTSVSVTVS